MSKLIENTMMFNTIAATFKASDTDSIKRFIVTADRGKQVADAGDQYIVVPKPIDKD